MRLFAQGFYPGGDLNLKGLDAFLKIFGNITVLQIVEIVLAVIFMIFVYTQTKKFFKKQIEKQNEKAEMEKERDAKINEALEAVHQYPKYREQSIKIQEGLEAQINELKSMHKETSDRLTKMEENTMRRERNKIRDRLLQSYRFYTNPETNPSHSWTEMEADAFWELFGEYEANGGDGYMHTDVQPDMLSLNVIKLGENKK